METFRKFLVFWFLIFMTIGFCQNNNQQEFISTFLGGSEIDEHYESIIIEGPDGYIYVSGCTESANFPVTSGSYDDSFNGGKDRFICKFEKDLKTLVASTFLGGSGDETGMGLCFDEEGNLYIAGYTTSSNFPTTGSAYDRSYGGYGDIFITKMDKDLKTVINSTYYGGYHQEGPWFPRIDIIADNSGEIYIAGITMTPGLAKSGSYDTSHNGNLDLIVAKFNSELTSLQAATYLGSSAYDYRPSIIIDKNGDIVVGGDAGGSDYPTTSGVYQQNYKDGGYDIVVSKLSPDLSTLLASTYVGTTKEEDLLSIYVDEENNIIFSGYSNSPNYPVSSDAYDKYLNGDYDMVITKMDNNLTKVLNSTFIGGSNKDAADDFVIDDEGNVYITGYTSSSNFPVTNGCFDLSHNNGSDVCLVKLDKNFTTLMASTFIGGSNNERAKSLIIDDNKDIFFTGTTKSTNYPTTLGVFDESYNGGDNDCFISKLNSDLTLTSVNNELTNEIPKEFFLHNNFPNPFNPSTTIKFELDVASNVKVRIFNMTGEVVKTLVDENLPTGVYTTIWNGKNENGNEVSSGIYFCELKNHKTKKIIKMNLIK